MSSSFINTHILSSKRRITLVLMRCCQAWRPTMRRNVTSFNSQSCPRDGSTKETNPTKPYEDIPGPKGIRNFPIVGLALQMKPFGKFTPETFPFLMNEMVDQYGPIFRIRTSHPSVVITDTKDIATLVRSEGKYPIRPTSDLFNVYSKRTGMATNFFNLQGEEWWQLRAPMQKVMMKPSVMPRYLPEMNQVADDLIKMLSSGYLNNHDAEKTFMAYTAESVGAVCFNKRLGFIGRNQPQKLKKLQQAIIDVFDIASKALVGVSNSYKFYRSQDYNKFESAHLFLSKTFREFLKDAMGEHRMKQNVDGTDFLNYILNVCTEEDAFNIMQTSFFGAIESSASAIQVALHTLAKNQDKQDNLRKELRNVLGNNNKSNTFITDEDIRNMPYLKACVKEVYRMSPIAPAGMVRFLPSDVVFSGYKVPAGVQIYTHTMKTSQNAAIFENPDKFEPERWLRENNTSSSQITQTGGKDTSVDIAKKWAVIPFGVGARSCPGRRIFEQELYVLLSKLIHSLKVGLEPESQDVDFEYRLFRKPTKPLRFTFTPVE